MKQISKTTTPITKINLVTAISDVPGGVSLVKANLVENKIVPQMNPLTTPVDGKRTVCKQSILLAGSTTTSLLVDSETNHFKVGDYVGVKTSGIAYAITNIVTTNGVDTMTVGTAIDPVTEGDFIYEMGAESAVNTSVLKNEADVMLKEAFIVPEGELVFLSADAYARADVHENAIGSEYLATLDCKVIKY